MIFAKATKPTTNISKSIDSTTLLTVLSIGVLFFATAGCCSTFKNRTQKPSIAAWTRLTADLDDGLSEDIKQRVIELEYYERTAEDFVRMVTKWKSDNSRPVLAIWKCALAEAEKKYKCGKISSSVKSGIEQRVATKLCKRIRREIGVNDEVFELSDIIQCRQAQCLGYCQLYYVLGRALGLSVRPINVVELEGRRQLDVGEAHVSCIVDLSDAKTIMLDLVPGGFISKPFIFGHKFEQANPGKAGWQLNSDDNPLNIFGRVEVLSTEGLVAYKYNNLGSGYSASGQWADAELSYSRAIELNPSFAEAYNNRGIAQRLLGNLQQALLDYSKAVELRPDFVEAWNNRGVAYEKNGQLNKAVSDYTRALELKPNFAQAYNNRANAYAKMLKFEQAISDYNRAIGVDSKLAHAYGNRALSFAIVGKLRGAKKDLLKAVKLNPQLRSYASKISGRFNLGLTLDDQILLAVK